MVTQDMLRSCEGKQDLSEINFKFATALDLKKKIQFDSTARVRTYFWVIIYYEYQGIDKVFCLESKN